MYVANGTVSKEGLKFNRNCWGSHRSIGRTAVLQIRETAKRDVEILSQKNNTRSFSKNFVSFFIVIKNARCTSTNNALDEGCINPPSKVSTNGHKNLTGQLTQCLPTQTRQVLRSDHMTTARHECTCSSEFGTRQHIHMRQLQIIFPGQHEPKTLSTLHRTELEDDIIRRCHTHHVGTHPVNLSTSKIVSNTVGGFS
ncbi:unnamed protein product [Ectocarpus sp. 4 AP-2014]